MPADRSTQGLDREGAHVLVQRFSVRVLSGKAAGATRESDAGRLRIGTHPSNDLVLDDAAVSRFHCEISLVEGAPLLRDLGSTNGTRVDGVAVCAAPLSGGAQLVLGRTQLRFELDEERSRIPLSSASGFESMVGQSPAMRAVFARLEQAAQTDATVLLQGETGTGKDVAAESIHAASARQGQPFIIVDCGAIPANLLESELFGHERGAFTGADRERKGAFEAADGGTLFLDEVGELDLELQPRLLRVLESRHIQRVGGRERIPVDVRVIAATHRDLRADVNHKRFRSDLYYRLAVLEIFLPPLRERLEDLPALVERLLENMAAAQHAGASLLRTPAFVDELCRHTWPGNIRELRNYLERCLAFEGRVPLTSDAAPASTPTIDIEQPLRVAREAWLDHFERRYLEEMLRQHGGNVTGAAKAAGVDRVHYYRLMAKRGLR